MKENLQPTRIGPYRLTAGAARQLDLIAGEACTRFRLSIWNNASDIFQLEESIYGCGLQDHRVVDKADQAILEWTGTKESELVRQLLGRCAAPLIIQEAVEFDRHHYVTKLTTDYWYHGPSDSYDSYEMCLADNPYEDDVNLFWRAYRESLDQVVCLGELEYSAMYDRHGIGIPLALPTYREGYKFPHHDARQEGLQEFSELMSA